MSSFSELVKTFRLRTKRSCNSVAKETHIDPTYWSRIEKDERIPPRKYIVERMAHVLRLSRDETVLLVASAGYLPWDFEDTEVLTLVATVAHLATNHKLDPVQRAEYIRTITTVNNWFAHGGIG